MSGTSSFLAALLLVAGATSCPAQLVVPATDLGTALPNGFEPSGVAWHPGRECFLVVGDEGELVELSSTGAIRQSYAVGSDLEGVCVADPNGRFVYLAREQPDAILEYDLVSASITRVFDVSLFFPGPSNEGIEALTFVPDAADPEGGMFWAGSSLDGGVRRFHLPIVSSAVSTAVTYLGNLSISLQDELRGLCCDPAAGVVYALYTDPDVVLVVALDGTVLSNYPVPKPPVGTRPEGIAVRGCDVVLAQDSGPTSQPHIWRFTGVDEHSACRTFEGDVSGVATSVGGTQQLVLDLGPAAAGWPYLVIGSRSVGNPGITEGDLVVPLLIDDYFFLTLTSAGPPVHSGFLGLLDAQGRGSASITVPANFGPAIALVGKRLYHAAVAIDPAAGWFGHASNSVAIEFTL